jgi:hypothetical protein
MGKIRLAAIAAVLLLLPVAAHAQAVGGIGGGGFLQGFYSWIQSNAITTIAAFAIMGIGGAMAFLHFHLKNIVITCSGIWIAFNSLQLAGVIPH